MIYFKDEHNKIYSFLDDGSQDILIKENMVPITGEEFEELKKPRYAEEKLASQIRSQRNRLLTQCDWSQLIDVPQVTMDRWVPYRQALRDITEQVNFPYNVIFPIKPE